MRKAAEVLNNAIVKIERYVNDAEAAFVGFTVVEPIIICGRFDCFFFFSCIFEHQWHRDAK